MIHSHPINDPGHTSNIDQPTMTFMDAMVLVRAGKAVRRQGWVAFMIYVKTRIFSVYPGNPNFYALSIWSEDIMADDWVEVFDASLPS